MNKLKVLFVCTGNIDRSPTAEEIFRSYPGVEAKSAGTSELAPTRISKELVEWADLILVMEESPHNHIAPAMITAIMFAKNGVRLS